MRSKSSNNWIQVPASFAFNWKAEERTRISYKDFEKQEKNDTVKAIKKRSIANIGSLKDRRGDLWQYVLSKYWADTSFVVEDLILFRLVRECRLAPGA